MRLTIFAATGGIGRHLLEQAVDAGHEVTAAVRNPKNVTRDVRVVRVDLANPDAEPVEQAVWGADAVLSGLGARTSADLGVAGRGTRAIVDAMATVGTKRLVVVSAAPMGTVASPARPHPPKHDPGDGFFMRHLGANFAKAAFGKNYADLAVMEDTVFASALEWTIVRPPKLTDKPLNGAYRTEFGRNIRGGFSISRADVADCMLAMLARPDSIGQTVGVAA
jgi:putative NADH-flavin reductase